MLLFGFASDPEKFLLFSKPISLSGPWRQPDAGFVPGPCVYGVGGEGDSQWIQKTLGSNLSSAAYPAGRSLLREKEKEPF